MPVTPYCTIEGASQGPISQGCGVQSGHEDEILVQGVKHAVMVPRDPQSGQPTGTRVHGPFTISKVIDKSSPLLYNALCRGESLTKVEIKYYRTTEDGKMEHYFTTTLEDGLIVDLQHTVPHCQDPANGPFTHLEDVSFTYRRITWDNVADSTSATDDWREPST